MPAISSLPDPIKPALAQADQAAIDRHRGRFVPWIIAAFYLTFMAALIGFVFIAYAHPPAYSTEEAYDKGLAYNDTLSRATRQAAIGWQSTTAYAHGRISFGLHDKDNKPLAHARVRVWFVHPADKALDRQFDLAEDGNGNYWTDAPLPAAGLWTVHVTAALYGNEYQTVTQIEAP